VATLRSFSDLNLLRAHPSTASFVPLTWKGWWVADINDISTTEKPGTTDLFL
jgi:hypothetical protein